MPIRSKILVIIAGLCGLVSLLAPVAHAITISAEVRDNVVFVEGSDAGRKQPIYWDYDGGLDPVNVTTTNPKGKFSFEGDSPDDCPPDNCVGWLTVGSGLPISVDIAYESTGMEYCLKDEGEQLSSHGGNAVRAVGFVADDQVVSGGADALLRNWTLTLGPSGLIELIEPLPPHSPRELYHIPYDLDVSVSAAGSIIATGVGGWNGHANSPTLRIWPGDNLDPDPLMETQPTIGFVYSVSVAVSTVVDTSSDPPTPPENYWVAASGFYGDILVYSMDYDLDPPELTLSNTTDTRKKRTTALDISQGSSLPQGSSLVASASTGGIEIRSLPVLDLLRTLHHPSSWSASLAFAPNIIPGTTKLVSGTDSGETKFWTIKNLTEESEYVSVNSVDSGPVYSIAFSNDTEGTMIVAGGNGDITVYDPDLNILIWEEGAHAGRVNDVAFSPDNSLIVSGGADGALKLWSLSQLPCE